MPLYNDVPDQGFTHMPCPWAIADLLKEKVG
jgi:hypothetical protein